MPNSFVIPSNVIIESVFGCNANCRMCPIDKPTKRRKGVMPFDLYRHIIDEMRPHKDEISQLDLFGVGEPLLDKTLPGKINYAKQRGFGGLGIATNADLLDDQKQDLLLGTGIDAVIFSIESTKKEIHERIRRNTNFDRVVHNANELIRKRNQNNLKTKFVFRFINQKLNAGQWQEYRNYWGARIDKDKGDEVNFYTAHDWVGEIKNDMVKVRTENVEARKCYQIFERMFILYDGTMSMCSCDLHHPYIPVGNVNEDNTIDVYNNDKMKEIRKIHLSGNKNTIEICKKCNMLYCRSEKKVFS